MQLQEIIRTLRLEDAGAASPDGREVAGAYTSDLLSDVMGSARAGEVWLTVQSHLNLVAVAALKELAAVIVCGGRDVEASVLEKARDENVTVLKSGESCYEVGGRLWELGIRRA